MHQFHAREGLSAYFPGNLPHYCIDKIGVDEGKPAGVGVGEEAGVGEGEAAEVETVL